MGVNNVESRLTDRYQTTVPAAVRRALKLSKRDRLQYDILPDGAVVWSRAADEENDDPVLEKVLDCLVLDIAKNPKRVQAIEGRFVARLRTLTRSIPVDLEARLPEDDQE